MKQINVDAALDKHVGTFNPWRLCWTLYISVTHMFSSFFAIISFQWTSVEPQVSHCRLPDQLNRELFASNNQSSSSSSSIESPQNWPTLPSLNLFTLNETFGSKLFSKIIEFLPPDGDGNFHRLSSCYQLNTTNSYSSSMSKVPITCQHGYVHSISAHYDGRLLDSTITEWDLVCDRAYLNSIALSSFFAFSFLGAIFSCRLADVYGRRPLYIAAFLLSNLIQVVHGFSPNVYVYVVLRMFGGIMQQSMLILGFVMCMEMFPMRLRGTIGMVDNFAWPVASCLLTGLAYGVIRTWRQYYFVTGGLMLGFAPLLVWLPESVTWLNAVGRPDKAKEWINRAASGASISDCLANIFRFPSKNRIELLDNEFDNDIAINSIQPIEIKDPEKEKQEDVITVDSVTIDDQMSAQSQIIQYPLYKMVTDGTMRHHMASLIFIYISASVGFFYTQTKLVQIAQNPYLNFFLANIIEVPGYILAIFMLVRPGRRLTSIILYSGSALAISIVLVLVLSVPSSQFTASPTYNWVRVVLLLAGKLCIGAQFCVIFVYAAELMSTSLRSSGTGIGSTSARISFVICFFIKLVEKRMMWLMPTIVVVSNFGAALVCFWLPETCDKVLPDSIEEIRAWKRSSKGDEADENKIGDSR